MPFEVPVEFLRTRHVQFCLRHLRFLPRVYQSEDGNRMSLAYFALSSLDLLGAMDNIDTKERLEYIDWIYARQLPTGGFSGGPALPQSAHLVMTYTALLCLAILRDDFVKLRRSDCLNFVASCQTKSTGAFRPHPESTEEDVRMVYCAFSICSMLNHWEHIEKEQAIDYLHSCRTYDFAFSQEPGLEAQGGSTYCAVASLHLAGVELSNSDETLSWLVHRQITPDASQLLEDSPMEEDEEIDQVAIAFIVSRLAGFQGRPNKIPDACYSFWVTASLQILLPKTQLCGNQKNSAFLLACQDVRSGGIAKSPFSHPDIYHTYLSLAALSIGKLPQLAEMDPAINLSRASLLHLRQCLR